MSESDFNQAPTGLQELCRRALAWGGRNLAIENIMRIKCRSQLYEIMGLRLLSDASEFDEELRSSGHATTTMDCCRPAASYECDCSGRRPYVFRFDANRAKVNECNVKRM